VKLLLEDGTPIPRGALKFSDVTWIPAPIVHPAHGLSESPASSLTGMYVRASCRKAWSNSHLVPQQSVSRDPKGDPVALVVDGSDKVEQRKIAVDRAVGDRWLSTRG